MYESGSGFYLKRGHTEDGNAKIPVVRVVNMVCATSEFETGYKANGTEKIGRELTPYMEVKPGWFC